MKERPKSEEAGFDARLLRTAVLEGVVPAEGQKLTLRKIWPCRGVFPWHGELIGAEAPDRVVGFTSPKFRPSFTPLSSPQTCMRLRILAYSILNSKVACSPKKNFLASAKFSFPMNTPRKLLSSRGSLPCRNPGSENAVVLTTGMPL